MAELNVIENNDNFEKFTEEIIENDSLDDLELGNSPLHKAAACDIEDLKKILEFSNEKVDNENFMGWTPLMIACRNGKTEAVKLLIEKGADISKKNKLGVNCFNLSVSYGDNELVEIVLYRMLDGGISRNKIQENISPISVAIIFRNNNMLNFLISQGFDINAATWKTGLTPLMFAAAIASDKAVEILKAKGATKQAVNYMGINYKDITIWHRLGLNHIREEISNDESLMSFPQRMYYTQTQIMGAFNHISREHTRKKIKKKWKSINTQNIDFSESRYTHQNYINQLTINDVNGQNLTDTHVYPANTLKPYYIGPTNIPTERILQQPPLQDNPQVIHQAGQYMSSHNGVCYPLYMPPVNRADWQLNPYVMTPPHSQNYIQTVEVPPQNFISQNNVEYGQPAFFPTQMYIDGHTPYQNGQMYYVIP